MKIARYKMVKHVHEKENVLNDCRYKLMARTKHRWKKDGLSSLKYKLLQSDFEQLYTNLTVDLLYEESLAEFSAHANIDCSGKKKG